MTFQYSQKDGPVRNSRKCASLGVYVHIPFCRAKCDFCSFHSVNYDEDMVRIYLKTLAREIESLAGVYDKYEIDTVYFGGGTPSLVDPGDISKLIKVLNTAAPMSDSVEITLETNPAGFSRGRFDDYAQAGVNRVSCGIQTLDKTVYAQIGRKGGFADETFLDGFSRISQSRAFDIILGAGSSLQTLKTLLTYPVDHYSAYILSVDEGTPLYQRSFKAEEPLQCSEYRDICELFRESGFDHYEISNFARNGRYSRHNLKYWNFEDYIGFGAGAHSFVGGQRWCNDMLGTYISTKGNCRIQDSRTHNAAVVEFIMTKLRLSKGFTLNEFEMRFGVAHREILQEALRRSSFQIHDDEKIAVAQSDFLFLDSIVFELVSDFIE